MNDSLYPDSRLESMIECSLIITGTPKIPVGTTTTSSLTDGVPLIAIK